MVTVISAGGQLYVVVTSEEKGWGAVLVVLWGGGGENRDSFVDRMSLQTPSRMESFVESRGSRRTLLQTPTSVRDRS